MQKGLLVLERNLDSISKRHEDSKSEMKLVDYEMKLGIIKEEKKLAVEAKNCKIFVN